MVSEPGLSMIISRVLEPKNLGLLYFEHDFFKLMLRVCLQHENLELCMIRFEINQKTQKLKNAYLGRIGLSMHCSFLFFVT